MTLQVIGAGLPRTGTTSLKTALEQLLGGPCYHMFEVMPREDHPPAWLEIIGGDEGGFDRVFDGFVAAVDWPASSFWETLADRYPQAPVLLSRRSDPETWWRSVDKTVWESGRKLLEVPDLPFAQVVFGLMDRLGVSEYDDPDAAMAAYETHNQRVRDTIDPARLIEWEPSMGWGPLCDGLGVPVPGEEFPHNNSTAEFRTNAGFD
ncbi:MAG: sulfotransferase family protein [Actinomycetota bacterium]